jgi:hypothetical protein
VVPCLLLDEIVEDLSRNRNKRANLIAVTASTPPSIFWLKLHFTYLDFCPHYFLFP